MFVISSTLSQRKTRPPYFEDVSLDVPARAIDASGAQTAPEKACIADRVRTGVSNQWNSRVFGQ